MRGFALVETLVALALLTLALLLGLGLVLQQPRIVHRLDAQREAIERLEVVIEALRAGALPLASQSLRPKGPWRMRISIQVTPEGSPPGLYRVQASARYFIQGKLRRQKVETLLWRLAEEEP